jgi:exopolysaccharide biosynthesis polyprenyl glycosylphosphotransferase
MATIEQTEPSVVLRGTTSGPRIGALSELSPSPRPAFPVKQVPYARAKRAMDIIVAILAIIVLSPFFVLTALLVKLTSRGPLIFKQTRVGEGGKTFTCYKFRSMVTEAENLKRQLMHLNEASGPVFKMKNDPRVTPVGRYIRKLSLDELPQLFNVLQGHMSIVGPRPPVPSEVELYTERVRGRLAVKPGVTCLWQISGRSDIPFEQWVEMDLEYIENMTLWGDFVILLKTIPVVILGRGAR